MLLTTNGIEELEIKHKIKYDRLTTTLIDYNNNLMHYVNQYEEIVNDYIFQKKLKIPTKLCEFLLKSEIDNNQLKSELKGAIRFISSLSCIDGLIVMTPELTVLGFGTKIVTSEQPKYIYISPTAIINNSKLIKINSNFFGTRHQSMISFCWTNPSALGFVISQDGDIRAITRHGRKIVMWENIKVLQFKKSKKLKDSLIKNGS